MQVLLDQVIPVAYRLFRVRSVDPNGPDLEDWDEEDDEDDDRSDDLGMDGQQNGLCGAGVPGQLTFITGTHTGDVLLRMELHECEPPLDAASSEVVEVSFAPASPDTWFAPWEGSGSELALEQRDYRVRYSAAGFDSEDAEETGAQERYLVQFWPAPPAPDQVVRQTSETAAYWHRTAREGSPG
ncbi:hypothetical protein [Actinoplanes sp. NPDC049118]|uniref:hypothetical protein n=1 Tax=Actinoplanes sp. NPDC049118 TaxID=3155769 RepID=UPI003403B4ED